jgi:hypothetical protein
MVYKDKTISLKILFLALPEEGSRIEDTAMTDNALQEQYLKADPYQRIKMAP